MDLGVSYSLIIPQPKLSAFPQCISHDAMAKYRARLGPERAVEQKLTVMVLQQSFWPFSSHKAQEVIIPPLSSPLPPFFSNAVCSLVQKMQRELVDLRPSTMTSIKAIRSRGIIYSSPRDTVTGSRQPRPGRLHHTRLGWKV